MRTTFLFFVVVFAVLLGGCASATNKDIDRHVWYHSEEDAITNGLSSEHVARADLLGIEKEQDETFVFYHLGMALGVANIIKSDKGYSWDRISNYTQVDSQDQPFVSITGNITSEKKQTRKVVSGIVYSNKIKELQLYQNNNLVQSQVIDSVPRVFYFLVHDPNVDAASLRVEATY
ncbi:MAG: hypothetical protein ACXVO1_04455 [Tumebacillaceae bacterium]